MGRGGSGSAVGRGGGARVGGGNGIRGEDRRNSNEFRMPRAVQCSIGSVHTATDDGSIVDDDAANGGLICCKGELGLKGG